MWLPSLRKKPRAARGRNQVFKAQRFGTRQLAAEGSQFVSPAPLVPIVFGRQLDDELVVQETFDEAVERAGAEANLAAGSIFDVFHDQVAVLGAVSQRQQHVEGGRG